MSQHDGGQRGPDAPRPRRWLAGRTLRWRLIAGLVALLAVACAVVGAVTYVVLDRTLINQVDAQLLSAGGRYASCMETNDDDRARPGGGQPPPTAGPGAGAHARRTARRSPARRRARSAPGSRTASSPRRASSAPARSTLTAADKAALARLSPGQHSFSTMGLPSLHGEYRLLAVPGRDRDVLITGLPLADMEATMRKVALAELTVFAGALLFTGIIGTAFVGLSLRPLRRVAATATRVTELPLASGEVKLPERVPDADPRTEVGQVGAAFNRMLGTRGVGPETAGRQRGAAARVRR